MKIVFNGREFDSIEQMPPDVRAEYLSVLQSFGTAKDLGTAKDFATAKRFVTLKSLGSSGEVTETVNASYEYNGQVYHSRDELPAEAREALDRLAAHDPNAEMQVTTEMRPTETRPQVIVKHESHVFNERHERPGTFPWGLVLVLGAIIVVLLYVWLTGVKPPNLLRP